jgi:hypothetical protein
MLALKVAEDGAELTVDEDLDDAAPEPKHSGETVSLRGAAA